MVLVVPSALKGVPLLAPFVEKGIKCSGLPRGLSVLVGLFEHHVPFLLFFRKRKDSCRIASAYAVLNSHGKAQ